MCKALNSASGQVFFFVVAPFCSGPASLVSRKFIAVGPGCAKCFFFVALRWAPRPFGGARATKKTPSRVFFFAPAPGKGRGRRSPVPARGFSFPCLSPGPEQKKNTLGGVFFFAAAPRGRSLTHCGPGWRCLPLVLFFFLLRPRPDRGGVFFFAVAPPGRSLTHCGLGRFRQGPGGVFFLLRPRRVFLDNNKKCLGYYIGSKKTRRGHSKKKTPLPSASNQEPYLEDHGT